MRTNVDKGQYYFEPTKMFHQLQDLLEKYKEEEQQRFPTHLTNICFVPNPLADPTFAADQQLQADENLWLINRDELHIDKELGRGNFGVVSLGRWRNETKVAIKELIAMDTAEGYSNDADKYDKEKKNFEAEMEIMKKLNHPNLVKMYGICVDKLPFFIIQELCEKGDLKKHLETFKEGIGRIIEGKRNVPKFDQLIKWSHDIALGMSYLEKKEIVHRDLAARNVLLSKYSRAKVADFGLSQDKGHEEDNVAFPILWSPLEVLISRSFSTKSDVWSFGITVWEVFSFGDKPYGGMKRADLKYFLKSGNRIEPPNIYTKDEGDGERTNNVYNDILLKCWAKAPEDRPTFQMLCKELSIYINQNNIY